MASGDILICTYTALWSVADLPYTGLPYTGRSSMGMHYTALSYTGLPYTGITTESELALHPLEHSNGLCIAGHEHIETMLQ